VRYCLIFSKQKALHVEGFFAFSELKLSQLAPGILGLQLPLEKPQNCRNLSKKRFPPTP